MRQGNVEAAAQVLYSRTHTTTPPHTRCTHTHTHTHAHNTRIHTCIICPRLIADSLSGFSIARPLHPTPYDLYHIPDTRHPTTYTLHPASDTLHPTTYDLHPTPDTLSCLWRARSVSAFLLLALSLSLTLSPLSWQLRATAAAEFRLGGQSNDRSSMLEQLGQQVGGRGWGLCRGGWGRGGKAVGV